MELAALLPVALLAAVIGGAVGVVLGRFVWPSSRGGDPEALLKAQTQAAVLDRECSTLRSRAEQLDALHNAAAAEARTAGEDVARLVERVSGLTKQIEEQATQIGTLKSQRDATADEVRTTIVEVARLKERENSLTQRLEAQVAQLAELKSQLTVEFENIANRVLKANSAELSERSQKAIASILDPLKERIQEFQTKVETTYDLEKREVLLLKEQIRVVVETSNTIGSKADDLAKALRGDPQLLGSWGELALERVLEAAGLTEGREYISQGRGMGLKGESGGIQRPDVIVKLPEGRTMIVDSKAPLASYERLIAATDESERTGCTAQLVRDMEGHIDGLAGKRYQENEKLQAHECVLMFVPIEGALAAALTSDPELFVYAWKRHVVLVGPPTLLMTLRTVASIWRYEDQERNAQDIGRLAGELCDKVSSSLGDLNDVAEKIRGALDAHNEAVKRLSTGKGNALSIGERIRASGVKTKRPMPAMIIDGVSICTDAETSGDEVAVALAAG
jgi:DNA recombination protein RmuC